MIAAAFLLGCDDGDVPPEPGCDESCALEVSEPVECTDTDRASQRFDRLPSAPTARVNAARLGLASAGVVVADLTGEGVPDLFFPHENGVDSQLFVNANADEAPARLGGADLVGAVGGSAADFDDDGDLDLFVTRWDRPNVLLRNDGTGTFTDVTVEAGLVGASLFHQSSSWADFDLDGDLDLYVGGYGIKPEDKVYTDPNLPPADPDELWVNDGDGTFTDRSDLVPAELHDGYTFMSSWFDTNGDAFPELFIWNDYGNSYSTQVLRNEEGRAFSYVSGGTGLAVAFNAMGVAVADLNRDRLPDFAVSSLREVLVAESSGPGTAYAGTAWVKQLGVVPVAGGRQVYGWGAEFGDLDNDRDEDLVVAFGHWSQFDGDWNIRRQLDGVWIQGPGGRFTDEAEQWGANDPWSTRGLVLADLDGNGFLDIVKRVLDSATGTHGPLGVKYLARCDDRAWLVVSLQQADQNRHAIGARVTVTSPDGHEQTRWVTAGSTSMYSSGPPEAHFGLGQDDLVDIEVTWPDGGASHAYQVPTRRRATLTRQ